MTFEEFDKTIGGIKDLFDFNSDIEDVINKYTNSYGCFFTGKLIDITIDLLAIIMNDKNTKTHNSWLDYYIFELNFGKDYKDGDIIVDGKNVSLSNNRELYDFLVENNKN